MLPKFVESIVCPKSLWNKVFCSRSFMKIKLHPVNAITCILRLKLICLIAEKKTLGRCSHMCWIPSQMGFKFICNCDI